MSVELVDSWEPTGNDQMTTNRFLTPLSICNCLKGTQQLAGKCQTSFLLFCFLWNSNFKTSGAKLWLRQAS